MSSREDDDDVPRRRLRMPVALAVAFVGSSAAVAAWYGGCGTNMPDPVPDAGHHIEETVVDAPDVDAGADAQNVAVDAGVTPDAPVDARADAAADTPPPH